MILKKISLFLGGLFMSGAINSFPTNIYVGVDQQLNKIHFKKGYGDNVFKKNYPQANIYSGLKFKNGYSFEVGYFSAGLKSRYSILRTGDGIMGTNVPDILNPAIFNSFLKITGYHSSIINNFAPDSWDNFRLLGGFGLGFIKAEAVRLCIETGTPPREYNSKRHFTKHKVVLRLMIAPEYKFKNNLGLRASACFLNTRKMAMKADPVPNKFTPIIRPKDSFVYSLGMFLEF